MVESNIGHEAIHCEFADDPEMRELAEMFLADMSDRIEELERAWSEQDLTALARLAHQLKGASGGYGYPSLSEMAAQVERAIDQCAKLDAIQSAFDSLVDSCRRAAV